MNKERVVDMLDNSIVMWDPHNPDIANDDYETKLRFFHYQEALKSVREALEDPYYG